MKTKLGLKKKMFDHLRKAEKQLAELKRLL